MRYTHSKTTRFYCRGLYLLTTIALIAGCAIPDANSPGNSRSATSTEAWQVFETPLLQTRRMAQVAIIVEDIENSAEFYASMFGIDKPDAIVGAGHESRPTMYRGKPHPPYKLNIIKPFPYRG